jgi:hypothetical protein
VSEESVHDVLAAYVSKDRGLGPLDEWVRRFAAAYNREIAAKDATIERLKERLRFHGAIGV